MKKIPGRVSTTTHELLFRTDSIPPMGFKSFYVELVNSNSSNKHSMASNIAKMDATSTTIGDPVCIIEFQSIILVKFCMWKMYILT